MNQPERLAAIILAAGASRRMGRVKALLPIGGETFIDRLIRVFGARCHPVIVVAGHHAEAISAGSERALEAQWVLNPRPARGQFSSLQCGVRALPDDLGGFCFCPVDVPAFREATLDSLLQAFFRRTDGAAVFRPRHEGRRGHPVALSNAMANAILAEPAESSAKHLLSRHASQEVPVDDPAILADVDEPADYRDLLASRTTDV